MIRASASDSERRDKTRAAQEEAFVIRPALKLSSSGGVWCERSKDVWKISFKVLGETCHFHPFSEAVLACSSKQFVGFSQERQALGLGSSQHPHIPALRPTSLRGSRGSARGFSWKNSQITWYCFPVAQLKLKLEKKCQIWSNTCQMKLKKKLHLLGFQILLQVGILALLEQVAFRSMSTPFSWSQVAVFWSFQIDTCKVLGDCLRLTILLTKINLWTFTSCHDPIKTYATPFACDVEFPALQLLSLRLESLCTLELLPMMGCHRKQQNGRAFPGFVCFCMLLIAKSTNAKTLMSCVHRTQLKKVAASNNVGHRSIFVSFPLLLQPLDGLLLPAFDIHVAFDLGVRGSNCSKRRNALESTLCSPEC